MVNHKKGKIEREIARLTKKIKKYLVGFDEKKFLKAYKFAKEAHEGQLRKDNITPYIYHPLAAADILSDLHADEDSLITALLHDVPEDTKRTLSEVEELFGKNIAFLVNGITKLSKVYYRHDMAERQVESLKKLLIHSAKDPRVILIKLADRLHNMTTLGNVRPDKRLRIAKETLEIYVPIANLLGIDEIKKSLEDFCFKYLFPKDYEKVTEKLSQIAINQENVLQKTIKKVSKALKEEGISDFTISGRHKTPYSVFKKSKRKDRLPQELEDLLALRIVLNDVKSCYYSLGVIHALFKPKPRRFKDYIAVPKINGYQSLHSIVFGVDGHITEFQIRTDQMHLDAQYGIAAHYFYRDSRESSEGKESKHSFWAKKILEYQKSNFDSQNFIESLKIDVFQDRIFTFSPRGDTIDLPIGATAIDFAYHIHTEVGNNALKAEINGKIAPLTSMLQTGDTVQIITANIPKGPNREWLIFAKTNLAKNKIREALRTISRIKKLRIGKRLLQKEFDRAGIGLIEELSSRKAKLVLIKHGKPHQCNTLEDVMVAIGDGSIDPVEIVHSVFPKKEILTSASFSLIRRFFHLPESKRKRVGINVKAIDRIGAGKDILGLLSEADINVVSLKVHPRTSSQIFSMDLTLELDSFDQFSYICEKMEQIDEILEVRRRFHGKRITFYMMAAFTIALWCIHPFLTYYLLNNPGIEIPQSLVVYGGILMLFFLAYQLKNITKRGFPEIRDTGKILWLLTFIIGNFALLTIIGEIIFYQLRFNWIIVFGLVLFTYAYLASEYIDYKRSN